MLRKLNNDQDIIEMLEKSEKPQESASEAVLKSCLAFANQDIGAGRVGEKYLQCVVNKSIGGEAAAAAAAGLLADIYFLNGSAELSSQSRNYNKIAGTTYQQRGDEAAASHYFNQYLASTRHISECASEDVKQVVSFLLANNTLVCTEGLLVLLQKLADAASDDIVRRDLTRLVSRAENRTIYMEISKQDAKRFLNAAIEDFKLKLKSAAAQGNPVTVAATSGTLFAGTKKEETEAAATSRPVI